MNWGANGVPSARAPTSLARSMMTRCPRGSMKPASPGVEPPVGIDDLARGLLVLQIALEHVAAAHEHLAALGDLDLDAGHRAPGARGIGLGVGLHRHQPGGLGGAVDLFQVHADRAEEPEGVGPERRPAGERPLGLSETELVPDGPVDEELAERGGQTQSRGNGLAVGAQDLGALGRRAEVVEGPSLERRGVGGAHLDRGEHVLPDPGRSQERRGAQLAQVPLHRLRALGTVGAEPHGEAREERVDRVARPRHRQIGQRRVLRLEPRLPCKALGHADGIGVGDHRALGAAGRAGGVRDDGDVRRLPLVDLGLEVAGMLGAELAAGLLHVLVGLEPVVLVPAHAAGVVIDHEAEGGQLARAATAPCRPAPGLPRRSR